VRARRPCRERRRRRRRLHALANDDQTDTIDCGAGNDTVWLNVNESDTHVNCETVKTVTVAGVSSDD
jgi:hypothetical protein